MSEVITRAGDVVGHEFHGNQYVGGVNTTAAKLTDSEHKAYRKYFNIHKDYLTQRGWKPATDEEAHAQTLEFALGSGARKSDLEYELKEGSTGVRYDPHGYTLSPATQRGAIKVALANPHLYKAGKLSAADIGEAGIVRATDIFEKGVIFDEALQLHRVKNILPTTLDSAGIKEQLGRDIYQRAFVSATVNEADILNVFKNGIDRILQGNGNASDIRYAYNQMITEQGGDPLPLSRQNLIIETNLDLARGYGQKMLSLDPDVVIAFPAWELFRLEPRKEPRDWPERWMTAGQMSGDEDAIRVFEEFGIMAARKDSDIWSELGSSANFDDALDTDFTPLAFDSGMWMRDYGRDDCIRIGLLAPDESVEPDELEDFGADAQWGAGSLSDMLMGLLLGALGGTVKKKGDSLVLA